MSMDQDESLFEDMDFKDVMVKEIKITENLENLLGEVKHNLKTKKIIETKTTLRKIEQVVNENVIEMKNVEQYNRHLDSDETNMLRNLQFIKNNIENFENLAATKFRKVVEKDINIILEELNVIKVNRILTLKSIFDVSFSEHIK